MTPNIMSCFLSILFQDEQIISGPPVPPVPFNVLASKSDNSIIVTWS